MSLLFVADPLEAFKTYKDTTFAMMREAARPRPDRLYAGRPGMEERRQGHRDGRALLHVDRARRRLVRGARAARRRAGECPRGVDAQGPAVRQRVLLRDAPAAAGRAR